jgi:serine/threonine protein kinase
MYACSSAENLETGEKVAIKKVSKAFEDIVDAKRILREIKLLQHFDHENVITIVDLLPPAGIAHFDDVYIISDLMETDLHRIIYSRQPLTDDHIQYFLYQVCALEAKRLVRWRALPECLSSNHRSCARSSTSTRQTCCIAT